MSAQRGEADAHARGGFEPDRVNLRAYYRALAAGIGVTLLAVVLVNAVLPRVWHVLRQPTVTPVLRAERTPEPHLQVDPPGELQALRAQERARLASYGLVDRERGVVHIPIELAKQRLLERGVPVRPNARVTAGAEAQ